MAYANFTQALMNLKRRAQLTGNPFSTADVQNLQSSYAEGAAERAMAERSEGLAQKSLTTQENALNAQQKNFADTLAQEKELAGRSEAQTRELAQSQMEAADAATRKGVYGNLIGTGASLGGAYLLARPEGVSTAAKPIIQDMLANYAANQALSHGGAMSTSTGLGTVGPATGANISAGMGGAGEAATAYSGGATLGGAGSAAMSAAPYAVAGYYGAKYGGKALENVSGEKTFGASIGRTIQDPLAGPSRAAADEFLPEGDFKDAVEKAEDIFNPIAPIFRSAGCIIVTACTSPDSEEVNITRAYRDKFLDPVTLRGYYMIADKIVPLMKKWPWFKKLIKKVLVDNLIEYGRWALEKEAGFLAHDSQNLVPVSM